MPTPASHDLHLTMDPAADALLSRDPLALLTGMLLDQQFPMERAFAGPYLLRERLGCDLDAATISEMDPDEFAKLAATPPAVHRYPTSMAGRIQQLCSVIVSEYGGDPTAIWTTVRTAPELVARLKKLPGYGEYKAKIFVALLGKQLGVRPRGWREASSPYGAAGTRRSIADVTSAKTLAEVRAFKQEMKAAHKQLSQGSHAT